jgi:hypothetical protein
MRSAFIIAVGDRKERLDVDGRIIVKWILRSVVYGCGLESSDSRCPAACSRDNDSDHRLI